MELTLNDTSLQALRTDCKCSVAWLVGDLYNLRLDTEQLRTMQHYISGRVEYSHMILSCNYFVGF